MVIPRATRTHFQLHKVLLERPQIPPLILIKVFKIIRINISKLIICEYAHIASSSNISLNPSRIHRKPQRSFEKESHQGSQTPNNPASHSDHNQVRPTRLNQTPVTEFREPSLEAKIHDLLGIVGQYQQNDIFTVRDFVRSVSQQDGMVTTQTLTLLQTINSRLSQIHKIEDHMIRNEFTKHPRAIVFWINGYLTHRANLGHQAIRDVTGRTIR